MGTELKEGNVKIIVTCHLMTGICSENCIARKSHHINREYLLRWLVASLGDMSWDHLSICALLMTQSSLHSP